MKIEKILNSSFEERMNWTLEDLEEAESLMGFKQDREMKKVMELEESHGLDYGELLDYYHLENNIWREVKATYPDIETPSLNIEYLQKLSEEDRQEYMDIQTYARKNFKSKTIEMKKRLYAETEKIHKAHLVSE